jgi:hypothetical protein
MKGARQLTSLFFPAALALCLPAQAAAPLINSVVANPALTAITINGSNFSGNSVFLSGVATPLTVTSSSANQIMANLPAGLAPGSYAVRVQGNGNNFDEFFATFVAPPAASAPCTSYSNAGSSGSFDAQVSVLQGGSYALSAKLAVNSFPPGPNAFGCSLGQVSGGNVTNIDQIFVSGTGPLLVMLQATTTVPGPAFFVAGCSQVTAAGTTPPTSYFNWKIQAVCLEALVSPSALPSPP